MDIGGCGDDIDINDCDDDMDIGVETDSDYNSKEEELWFVFPLVGKMVAYFQWHYDKCPMHTSILSGKDYMAKVRDDNPSNYRDMFRITLDLFYHLVDELKHHGYLKEGNGRVDVQKSMAIFLYIVRHNTWMQPVADRVQHSIETVDRKFHRVLQVVHTYEQHLIKPNPNVVGLPEHLQGNNKYYPWFEKSIGAIDETHISAWPPAERVHSHRSHKSTVTTNVTCTCNHDMRFTYVHFGWEGRANDSRLFEEAIKDPKHGFPWPPEGSYYLVDSGYHIGASFLPPHKITRCDAQEFKSNRQPTLGKELFNYRHSSLRMVIKRCFGVLKAHFSILSCMVNYKQYRQCLVVSVCCALHNFIRINNKKDVLFNTWENLDLDRDDVQTRNNGNSPESSVSAEGRHVREMSDVAKRAMSEFRDDMTDRMWEEYV
ncbi:uncharacterized protein LOC111986405 [Quercus suber]|uniref:uncharacterized protein LOC111986405 n=1 Tax=Quercus suber TaxID=58331 RepID=UPI000CE17B0E|nr:uncharacterized protein LOC111986405 [Quercus suber]